MRVAIAAQSDFVAPRLDRAPQLFVIECDGAAQNRVDVVNITLWPAHGRASRLALMRINAVICGGISAFDAAGFEATSVKLIAGVSGPISKVIDAVRRGTIAVGQSYWKPARGDQPGT